MIAAHMVLRQQPTSSRMWLVAALVLAWGVRLAIHVYSRNRGKAEDFRYAQWRKDWGKWFLIRSYLQVFVLQGLFMLGIAASIIVVGADGGGTLGWLDLLGVAVWLLGFVFESVGDAQLKAFVSDPASRGRILDTGLWRYTRHPNYFGEATQWWGLWLIALSVPMGWVAFVSPLLITWTLVFVSGVPMLEKKMAEKPGWAEYAARTSVFVPLPPKKG
jgi:steroid 5-alpha reductase family enzyme